MATSAKCPVSKRIGFQPGGAVSAGALYLALTVGGTAAAADTQRVYPTPETQAVGTSAAVHVDLSYTTSNSDATVTGLGVRIHFDSSKLTYATPTNVLATGLMGRQEPQDDTANLDGDAATDKFILVSWADIAGNWPGQVPVRLLTLNFTTSASFSGSTTIRFTASSTAAGYTFAATPATVTASGGPPPVGPPISQAGPNLYYAATCGHLKGKGTTSWVTDLVAHNPGTSSATVNVYFLKKDDDNSSVHGKTFTVPGGTSLRLPDVVLATFAESSSAGALLVGSTQPLVVSSRTFNDADSGTYGQYVEGSPAQSAIAGTAQARLIQLTKNASYRTNIGFVNATSSSLPVQVALYRADGTSLGTRSYTVKPYGSFQETDIIGKVTSANVDDAYAVITSSSGSAKYFTYASVVDARTGDPITVVPPEGREAGSSGVPVAGSLEGKLRARELCPPSAQAEVEGDVPVHATLDERAARVVWMQPTAGEAAGVLATQQIFADGFEGSFPGGWATSRGENPAGSPATDAVWGKSTYRKATGSASLWCAAGGSQAGTPGGDYLSYMNTWVIYGPFSLADASAAHATFKYWMKTEAEWSVYGDPFMWMISIDTDASDGRDYFGFKTSGDSNGWQNKDFDFSTVTSVAALGKSQVWFALVFRSDVSDQMEGVYVDDVVIEKTTSGACTAPAAPTVTAPGTVSSGTGYNVTWTATSADNSYEIEEATSSSFTGASRFSVTGTSRSFTHTVSSTTTYYYRVRATQQCGGSPYTSSWSATKQTAVSGGGGGGESLWVPGTAALTGSQGSNWKTDLEVHNAGSTRADFTVAMHKRGETTTTPPSKPLSLDPGKSVRYSNALQALFAASGAATLRVTTAAPDLIVTSRTYNDQPEGTYGQFVPGMWAQAGVPSGTTVRLVQLAQSSSAQQGFRTNVGLCNLTALTISVEVKLYRGDGTALGTKTYTLRPFESIQRDKIFTEVTSEAVDDGFAVLRTTTSGGVFTAFASVIDNRSNDPIFIPAR